MWKDVAQAFESISHICFPPRDLPADDVRLVFLERDYETDAIQRDAGLAWVRRQWQKTPEPTLVLGFEPEEAVRGRAEGDLLKSDGITYLQLPVPLTRIEQAVAWLRDTRPGALDSPAIERNVQDFACDLRGWRHSFKNASGSIWGRIKQLRCAAYRQAEYEELATKPPATMAKWADAFAARRKAYNGLPALQRASKELDAIEEILKRTQEQFAHLLDVVSDKYAPSRVETVIEMLEGLKQLDREIMANVDRALETINPKSKNKKWMRRKKR